jgi:hypothetical protein
MGSLFLNLKEKSPIRLASSQGASLTFLFTIMLLVFIIALLFFPIYNYYNDFLSYQARLRNIFFFSIVISLISLIISFISFSLLAKSLKRDF